MPTSKPTNVDAQRILAIMDELKEKLTFLSVITGPVLDNLQNQEDSQTATDLLGPELLKQFAEQIRLEELYVVSHQASDGSYTQHEENEENQEDIKLLQKNTLELCRKMKAVPNIVAELRNFQETRPGAVISFLKTLADMQDLTLKRLTTTVEEERSRQELLKHYNLREEEASKRKGQLDKDLNHIRRERERASSVRTDQLTKLKADLLDIKVNSTENMKDLRRRYEERMKVHQEAFNSREKELKTRIEALKDSNKKLVSASQDEENNKKRQVKRNETEVREGIDKYDTDIKEVVDSFHVHVEGYKKERKQLQELREHFVKVDEEKQCIEHEDGLAQARRSKMEQEKKKRNDSSCLVQAFWRGITQREQYQDMKKKLKKGKKGGGKKKGK